MIIYLKCREIVGRALGFLHPSVLMAHVRGNYHDRKKRKDLILQQETNIVALASRYLEDNTRITETRFSWKWKEQLWDSIDDDELRNADEKENLKKLIDESSNTILDCEQYLWRTSNEYAFMPFIIAKSLLYTSFILLVELPLTIVGHVLQYAVWPVTVYTLRKCWGLTIKTASFLYEKLKRPAADDNLEIERQTLQPQNESDIKAAVLSGSNSDMLLNQWQSTRSETRLETSSEAAAQNPAPSPTSFARKSAARSSSPNNNQ